MFTVKRRARSQPYRCDLLANVNSCRQYSLAAICRLIIVITAVCNCTRRYHSKQLTSVQPSSVSRQIDRIEQKRRPTTNRYRQLRLTLDDRLQNFYLECLTNDLFFPQTFIVCIMFMFICSALAVIRLLNATPGSHKSFQSLATPVLFLVINVFL